jgi:hypothetical protein
LELFITLSILAITAGLLGWHFKGAFDHHRFQNEVDQFVIHLKQLQTQALSYQTDIGVVLRQGPDGASYQDFTDDRIKGVDIAKKTKWRGISSFTHEKHKVAELKLHIFSTGRIDPPVILVFCQGEKKLYLDLRTPLKIALSSDAPQTLDPIPSQPKEKTNATNQHRLPAGEKDPR